MFWLIGQSDPTQRLSWEGFYWALVIMGMLGVGWVIIAFVKRKADASQVSAPAIPFTLHDLKKLRDQGQLTDEEYQKARDRIVAMSKSQLAPKDPKARPPQTLQAEKPAAPPPAEPPTPCP